MTNELFITVAVYSLSFLAIHYILSLGGVLDAIESVRKLKSDLVESHKKITTLKSKILFLRHQKKSTRPHTLDHAREILEYNAICARLDVEQKNLSRKRKACWPLGNLIK